MDYYCSNPNNIFDSWVGIKMSAISDKIFKKLNEEIPGSAKILSPADIQHVPKPASDVYVKIIRKEFTDEIVVNAFPGTGHNDSVEEVLATLAQIMQFLDVETISNGTIKQHVDQLYENSLEFYGIKYPTQKENLDHIILLSRQEATPWILLALFVVCACGMITALTIALTYSISECN